MSKPIAANPAHPLSQMSPAPKPAQDKRIQQIFWKALAYLVMIGTAIASPVLLTFSGLPLLTCLALGVIAMLTATCAAIKCLDKAVTLQNS